MLRAPQSQGDITSGGVHVNAVEDPNVGVDASLEDDLHELEVQFAFTEPRSGARPNLAISEKIFEARIDPTNEVSAFVYRWENSSIEAYQEIAADMQLDPLRMIVSGQVFDVGLSELKSMQRDPTLQAVLRNFPPCGP